MASLGNSDTNSSWERSVLEELALSTIKEQRANRRWRNFFRVMWLLFIFTFIALVVYAAVSPDASTVAPTSHTALVRVEGPISADGEVNAERVTTALTNAFKEPTSKAVVIKINSPGGSPVQSGIIHDEIKRLKSQYKKPVYVVVEDICASGGYYIAVAADKIYVNQASIVGSIGVIVESFGVTELMSKVGVERRLIVTGDNKAMLDPFSPESETQRANMQTLVNNVYQQFVSAVRAGRGQRLRETPDMFSGAVWTGTQSIQLGLSDAQGSVGSVSRDVVKEGHIIDYTVRENIAERLAKQLGMGMGMSLSNTTVDSVKTAEAWRWR